MNSRVKETIANIVESPLVLSCLEIAELLEPDDFINFSHTNVDILENYIRCRTSVMDINDRIFYLSEEFIHFPEKFMFTPGMRNRLLKAAKLISKDVYAAVFESNQSSDCESNEMSCDSNNNNSINQINKLEPQNNDNNNPSIDNSIIENQFLLSPLHNNNCSSSSLIIKEQLDLNRSRHLQNMEKYYNDIVKNAAKNFIDCSLTPDVDFHLSIPENDSSDLIGYYHCHLCTDRKKAMTKIKFRFSKYNSVIYTNINSHLKTHYQYVLESSSDRKRPKLSNSVNLLTGGLLSDRENNLDSGNENKLEIES